MSSSMNIRFGNDVNGLQLFQGQRNPGSIASGGQDFFSFTIPGLDDRDHVLVVSPNGLGSGIFHSIRHFRDGTSRVQLVTHNISGSATDPADAQLFFLVVKAADIANVPVISELS